MNSLSIRLLRFARAYADQNNKQIMPISVILITFKIALCEKKCQSWSIFSDKKGDEFSFTVCIIIFVGMVAAPRFQHTYREGETVSALENVYYV